MDLSASERKYFLLVIGMTSGTMKEPAMAPRGRKPFRSEVIVCAGRVT